MRKVVYPINVTPDGFCDHTSAVPTDELHRYYTDILKNADLVLFGRVTFQLFESYWPPVAKHASGSCVENEFAKTLENVNKIVFSKTIKNTHWKNTSIVSDDAGTEILRLKNMPGKNIYVAGSPCLANTLMKAGLIDEYHFCIHPLVAGSRKRFFEHDTLKKEIDLQLMDTKAFASGVVAHCYRTKEKV